MAFQQLVSQIYYMLGGTPTAVSDTNRLPVNEPPSAIIAKTVDSATSAPLTIVTPSAGKSIRLWWYNIGAHPLNSAPVVVSLRFGSAGTDFYKTALSQYGAATAHSFKSGKSYVQGLLQAEMIQREFHGAEANSEMRDTTAG